MQSASTQRGRVRPKTGRRKNRYPRTCSLRAESFALLPPLRDNRRAHATSNSVLTLSRRFIIHSISITRSRSAGPAILPKAPTVLSLPSPRYRETLTAQVRSAISVVGAERLAAKPTCGGSRSQRLNGLGGRLSVLSTGARNCRSRSEDMVTISLCLSVV